MNHTISKAVMDKTTSVVSYATSGTVGLGGLLSSEWIMVISAVFFAALTFLVNWWYKRRGANEEQMQRAEHEQREREFHAARMAALKRRATDIDHHQDR